MVDSKDSAKIIQLAGEGKQISKIWEEDFPDYDYWEVYWEVYGAGEKSSNGTRRMITNRLNKLLTASKVEQKQIIEEIDSLVWHLYNRYKGNQKKLSDIRKIIEK